MAALVYTPITPRNGGLIHATTIHSPFHTACGLEWEGWIIAPLKLTCSACEAALFNNKAKGVKLGRGKKKKKGKRK